MSRVRSKTTMHWEEQKGGKELDQAVDVGTLARSDPAANIELSRMFEGTCCGWDWNPCGGREGVISEMSGLAGVRRVFERLTALSMTSPPAIG